MTLISQIYVGSYGGILRSSDDGLTWSKVSSLQPWTFITFDSAGYLYLANGSTLYKSVSKTLTSVSANQGKPPSRFLLNANYPNPFNPSTLISFSTTREGPVALRIYDILGREVATLVNENRKPGKYTERWDGGRASSGVYVYVLRSSEGQLVGKMALLK